MTVEDDHQCIHMFYKNTSGNATAASSEAENETHLNISFGGWDSVNIYGGSNKVT